MLENIIKILKSYIKEYKRETASLFKDFIKSELWITKVKYDDIEKYVFNIDWPDPSFDVWMIRWLEMFLNKINISYNNTVHFTLEVLQENVIDIFWLDKISELKDITDRYYYSDILEFYNALFYRLWLSFVVVELNTWDDSLWTKVMIELWDKYVELDDFDTTYKSINKLYLVLNDLENKCKALISLRDKLWNTI